MSFETITSYVASVPIDWIIIGAFTIFAAFDALRSGARRACTLALALPTTVLLSTSISKAAILGSVTEQFSNSVLGAILFGIVFVIVYILIARIGLAWGNEGRQPIQAALTGVAVTSIVVTIWVATPPLDALWHFGPQVQMVFGESYRFWWLFAGYAALAYVRGS